MRLPVVVASVCVLLASAGAVYGQNMLSNASFESGTLYWSRDTSYSIQARSSGWNGVDAYDGNRFLAVSGPADVGYSYAEIVSQSLSAPFGAGIPDDNFVVFLYAATYLHTNDGRNVSYAMTVEPGYGGMGSTFYGGAQDEWAIAQTSAYYYAHDPYDLSSPARPLKVTLELRDSLLAGEYLILDDVWLAYGGVGTPEPATLVALAVGIASISIRMRARRRT